MARDKSDPERELGKRVYGYVHRRALQAIVAAGERELDALYTRLAEELQDELAGLRRHPTREVASVLRQKFGREFVAERQRILESAFDDPGASPSDPPRLKVVRGGRKAPAPPDHRK